MKKTYRAKLFVAAVFLAAVTSGAAEAKKPVRGGGGGTSSGGGGVTTNYGCKTLNAGTLLRSIDGARTMASSVINPGRL